jgi:hypothetical protein
MKRVTAAGAGVSYALRNASDEQARSWEPKKTSASSSPSSPLTLASPVNHQRCFRPSHVLELASFSRRQDAFHFHRLGFPTSLFYAAMSANVAVLMSLSWHHFHAVSVPTSSYRSRAFFGSGLESGKGGLETIQCRSLCESRYCVITDWNGLDRPER